MMVAGIDEAGRGCVIGPMIIACVLFKDETLPTLVEIGVKDSKKLSANKRTSLADEIKELALNYKIFELQPRVIDKVVFRSQPLRRLNYLETMVMAKLIREIEPDLVQMDSPDIDNQRCTEQIKSVIRFNPKIICEHKADQKYPSTGAASIIAKVIRDQRISELIEKYGDFNSGYPSDKKTQEFIKSYFSKNKKCPEFIRASWKTVQRYLE